MHIAIIYLEFIILGLKLCQNSSKAIITIGYLDLISYIYTIICFETLKIRVLSFVLSL
jgi:hypothetical protein